MKQKLHDIVGLTKIGYDYRYILSTYVDTSYWIDSAKDYFQGMYIENLTDFNYSRCFTIYINISDINSKTGTKKFNEFIKEKLSLYRIQIQISAIAPYALYKFIKYEFKDGEVNMKESFIPFLEEHCYIEKIVTEFLNKSGLTILDKTLLSIEIPNISMEMRKSNVTIYHYLFEDEY